jgi:hypothetical protein
MNKETHIAEVHMFDLDIAPALRDFMGSNLCDLGECIDWVLYTFEVPATDFLVDRITDEFEEFFGV